MRHIITVLLLAVLLVGCGGVAGPILEPADLFTGEPTPAVIEVHRPSTSAGQAAMSSMAMMSEPAKDTLTAIITVQRTTPAGHVDFERIHTMDIPPGAPMFELPVELPAEPRYSVHVTIYDPSRKSQDHMYYMLEVGTKKGVGIMADAANVIPVSTGTIEYEFTAPDRMYSGGSLAQFEFRLANHDPDLRVTRMYGLNPWTGNGVGPFWSVNAGHGGTGIPDTGWINRGFVPAVNEPTPLYYQVSICAPFRLADDWAWMCHYGPDVEAGEPLPHVMIHPEPDDF